MKARCAARLLAAAALLGLVACAAGGGSSAPAGTAARSAVPPPEPAASAAAPAGGPATGTAPTPLVVSFSQITGNSLALWVAKEAGIFEQNGLAPELQLVEGNKGIAALLAGETQFADIGGSQTLSAAASGADLVVLSVAAPVYPFQFMVPPSISSAADLKGKNVGVSTIGDSSDTATRLALPALGLEVNTDVTIVPTGSSRNRVDALVSGALQGGMSSVPESLALEAQGFRVLLDLAALGLPAASQSQVSRRSYVAANHDVAQRYVDSIVEAIALARRDRDLTVEVLKKYYRSTDDQVMGQTYDYYVGRVIPSLPYPKAEQFKDAQAVLGASNEQVRQFDLDQLLDPSFVQSAADRGLDR